MRRFALFSCSGENLELKVKARLDGQPAAQAKVTVDNEEQGLTGTDGIFSKIIKRKPGVEVEVIVSKEMPGYRIQPWKGTFVMKLPKAGTTDVYAFDADLAATRYVTITATEKGAPVADAIVKVAGKEVGKTDAQGVFVYEYKTLPKSGADLTVTKSGYATWRKTGKAGARPEARGRAQQACGCHDQHAHGGVRPFEWHPGHRREHQQ